MATQDTFSAKRRHCPANSDRQAFPVASYVMDASTKCPLHGVTNGDRQSLPSATIVNEASPIRENVHVSASIVIGCIIFMQIFLISLRWFPVDIDFGQDFILLRWNPRWLAGNFSFPLMLWLATFLARRGSASLIAEGARMWVQRSSNTVLVHIMGCVSRSALTVHVVKTCFHVLFMKVWPNSPVYGSGSEDSELWWAAEMAVVAVLFLFAMAPVILTWIPVMVIPQGLPQVDSPLKRRDSGHGV